MKHLRLLAACLALVALSCGGGKSAVNGKVSYKGKPLVCGTISFYYPDNTSVDGGIDPDGNFTIINAKPGKAKVTVVSNRPAGADPRAAGRGGAPAGPVADPAKWFEIPPKYNDPATTDKEVELKSGPNLINIDLD
jgi:hypothetical protein